MKYPEKYPDGFMRAAIKEGGNIDRGIILTGLNWYSRQMSKIVSGRHTELPMIIFVLRSYLKSLEKSESAACKIADFFSLVTGQEEVVIQTPANRE